MEYVVGIFAGLLVGSAIGYFFGQKNGKIKLDDYYGEVYKN